MESSKGGPSEVKRKGSKYIRTERDPIPGETGDPDILTWEKQLKENMAKEEHELKEP